MNDDKICLAHVDDMLIFVVRGVLKHRTDPWCAIL